MKKSALLGVILAGIFFVLAAVSIQPGTASADAGPHIATGSDATPDKCAGCHRIHSGENEYLLKSGSTVADFCYLCHGNGGLGSDLAVQEGTYYGTPAGEPYGGKPASTTLGLRAGGFDMARINTTDAGFEQIGVLAAGQPVTSWHTIDGSTTGTIWGNGAINSGAGPTFAMDCTSCHDPHGNGQYRILRPIPVGSGVSTGVTVTDEAGAKVYTTSNYFSTGPVSGLQMSSWCASCHTRYLSSSTADSGDDIFAYRHRSNGTLGTACIKCHAPHGTNAVASGTYSSTVGFPGGASGTTATDETKLLKMDNRGICLKCHTDY
jgi:predicted CXXCH cytochrome family protein